MEIYLLIDPLAENAQSEYSSNGRGQETCDRLNVIKQLSTLSRLHNGNPGNTDTNQNQNKQPTWTNTQQSVFRL